MNAEHWTDETPDCNERLADAGRIIAAKDAEIQRLVDVVDDICDMWINEGYAHCDACGCEQCELMRRAKRIVKETTPATLNQGEKCDG